MRLMNARVYFIGMCAFTICIDMNAHIIPSFYSLLADLYCYNGRFRFLPEAVPGLGDKSGDTCKGIDMWTIVMEMRLRWGIAW